MKTKAVPWKNNFLSGYLLSKAAAGCIYSKLKDLEYLHIEDAFITGFGAMLCGCRRWTSKKFRFKQ